jgi:hypothetical protein
MKKQTLIIIFLFIVAGLWGQEQKKYYLGGHFSHGMVNYSAKKLNPTSREDYSGNNYFTLSFDYAYRASEDTEFITGLSVTLIKMDFTNHVFGYNSGSYTYDSGFGIVSLPVGIRYYTGRYFYISGGISLNYYSDNIFGGRGFAGLGIEYSFKSGLTLSLAPHIQSKMLNFEMKDASEGKFLQIGCNIGIGHRF